MLKQVLFPFVILLITSNLDAQNMRILFDATKAETAGNADWIIDADENNLIWNPNATLNKGTESNAQQFPAPDLSGIDSATAETYWKGGLSNWGIDCVKRGFTVENLPYNGLITYNDSNNPQDLANYSVYVVCEPNILFTPDEKAAIRQYVKDGGSLFMIADHDKSDRNFDGYDSPAIWNDFTSETNMGLHFNLQDYSQSSSSIISDPADSISNGPFGQVKKVYWSGGTDMYIDTNLNKTLKGVVFKNGFLSDTSKVLMAYGYFGKGKFAAMGDSSPADDGTGDENDVLYNGYTEDANGNHQRLIMNTTIWLANHGVLTNVQTPNQADLDITANYIGSRFVLSNNTDRDFSIRIINAIGSDVMSGSRLERYSKNELPFYNNTSGLYYVIFTSKTSQIVKKVFVK